MSIIRLIGDVNEAMFLHLSTQLEKLEKARALHCTIELSSEGGVAYDGLAIAGRMQTSPVLITVRAYGKVMSAATAILAAGDRRECSRETWIMFHDSADKFKGQLTDLERRAKQLEAEEQQWANLMELHTGTPEAAWRKLSTKTTYLTATQAYQLGLIDRILEGKRKT